jgi:hypothetical protein
MPHGIKYDCHICLYVQMWCYMCICTVVCVRNYINLIPIISYLCNGKPLHLSVTWTYMYICKCKYNVYGLVKVPS